MKNNKFDDIKLLMAIMFGVGPSISSLVILMFGIVQIKIIELVGKGNAVEIFGVCSAVITVVMIILTPVEGYLIDKTNLFFGKRRFWILNGSVLGCIFMCLVANSSSIISLTINLIFVRFFYGIVSTSCFSILPEQINKNIAGRVYGWIGSSTPFCIMIISVFVMGYRSDFSVESKIITIAIIQLLSGVISTFMLKESINIDCGIYKNEKKYSYPNVEKHPEYTYCLIGNFLFSVLTSGLSVMSIFYITRFNLSEKNIFELQALMSIGLVLMIVSGIFFGYLSDKIKKQKIFLFYSSILSGMCMFLYAFSNDINVVIFVGFIFQLFIGARSTMSAAVINRVLPFKDRYAQDISIMNLANQIATALINLLIPFLVACGATWMGDDGYTLLFIFLGFFSIISAFIMNLIPEVK